MYVVNKVAYGDRELYLLVKWYCGVTFRTLRRTWFCQCRQDMRPLRVNDENHISLKVKKYDKYV